MKYEVWLGNIELYGAESVEESTERKITVYDAVGAGKFPQAENRGLKSWEIQCELTEHNDRHLPGWSVASDIFDDLESLLKKKTPARLVIRSDYGKTSERVLLKSFTKEETMSGVYTVKLSCAEYVSASVKTTDVPYVARPGKMPELPETVTISYKGDGSGMSPYDLETLKNQNQADSEMFNIVLNDKTGKPISNPATLREGDKVKPYRLINDDSGRAGYFDESGAWHEESAFGLESSAKGAMSWFKKYLTSYDKTVEETWNNPDWEGNKYMP